MALNRGFGELLGAWRGPIYVAKLNGVFLHTHRLRALGYITGLATFVAGKPHGGFGERGAETQPSEGLRHRHDAAASRESGRRTATPPRYSRRAAPRLYRAQSQIQRTLGEASAIERVAAILSQEQFDSRGAVGRRVCAEFDFLDHSGRPQVAGCLKALRNLEQSQERIVLPAAAGPRPGGELPPLVAGVGLASTLPERLAEVQGLVIEPVSDRAERAVWNTLIAHEHRQGLTTFAGAQMRYLVGSEHGWLGALGFAASALRLAARERWMGWSDAQRRQHLDLVVGLSRFLIRGGCANLASHVLGQVLRRLPQDFRQRYGYSPWLVETFCEACQAGTSLRAANFVRIGTTAGRGRQDRAQCRAAGVKSIYMYELRRDWRRRLGLPWVDPAPRLEVGAGLDAAHWAQNEFGGAQLGDKRLTARLVRSAALLAEYPGRALSANVRSDAAAVDGYYRLIEQPEQTEVTAESILAPHRERSIQRLRGQRTVLCIQDGSDLNFATRPGCEGLEVIGRNQTRSQTLGLHLHLTLAVNEKGLPLGVLRCGFGTPAQGGKSRRWIDGYRDIAECAQELTRRTRVIAVMDREADFFELFDEQRRAGRVEILVRAKHDRNLEQRGAKLFAKLAGGPPDGQIEVEIAGLTERPKASRKAARQKRRAACELRYRRVRLPATRKGAGRVGGRACGRERSAGGGTAGAVVPAHQPASGGCGGGGGDRAPLFAALASGGLLPAAESQAAGWDSWHFAQRTGCSERSRSTA